MAPDLPGVQHDRVSIVPYYTVLYGTKIADYSIVMLQYAGKGKGPLCIILRINNINRARDINTALYSFMLYYII